MTYLRWSFGADDKLECPKCRSTMTVCRRKPDLEHGNKYELQTFICVRCGYVQTRIADNDGEVSPDRFAKPFAGAKSE